MKASRLNGIAQRASGWLFAAVLLALVCEQSSAQSPGANSGRSPALSSLSLRKQHKVRVTEKSVAEQIEKDGGELIADYGSFQLFEVDAAVARRFEQRGVQNEDAQNRIALNSGVIDTTSPGRQAQRAVAAAFTGKRLRLVQFAGPVKPEWRDALEQTGARIVAYIPQNTYLVYGDAYVVGRMQGWARSARHVQWDGEFADEYKIHPRARRSEKPDSETPPTDVFAIQLVDDPAANAATLQLIDQIKLAPIRRQFQNLDYLNVIVDLPQDRVADIAARPEVVSIQPYVERQKFDERQNQIIAGNLTGGLPDGPGYLSWLASKGFTQSQFTSSGFAVDVSDSGVDRGSTNVGHFGLYQSGLTNLPSRLIYSRLEGTANSGSTLQGCDGHGTLNAHIIAGYNNQPNGFPHTDSLGFHYGLGVCPFVKIGSSVVFDPATFTSPNYNNLQSRAYNNGARVSANSWGSSGGGAYDVDAQNYDRLVRDAQPTGSAFATAGNQEMVIVFAAGNDGPSAQTVGSPGTAKNVITVGAGENVHSHSTANGGNSASGNSGCSSDSDSAANNANDMATFSSRGPCSDGRRKPDIVAPGTHVTGGVAQNFPPPSVFGTGSSISCFDGTGVCGLPGGGTTGNANNYFPLSQQFYTTSSGTSHSTPAVAGACALLRQYFINSSLAPPSPAMTKAFLMNSARYMDGSGANDSLWSNNQGMGELNLGFAFDGVARILRDQLTVDKFTASGQTRVFTGTIPSSSSPFRITLAWTDAPGSTAGNAFNNDLDLTVTVDGVAYKGNVFNGAYSSTGGSADSKNNVECVSLPSGVSGNFVVTVTAANINSDGVPNESPSIDQDFALVIYNAVGTAFPVMGVTGTSITAENCAMTNSSIDPFETVTMNFALGNYGMRDTTNLVVTLLATNGILPVSGPQSYGTVIAGGSSVTQAFTFTAVGNCGDTLTAVFQLQDGDGNLGLLPYDLSIGNLSLAVASTTNASPISIPASGTSGKASLFPSAISVAGITGNVTRVTVTLRSLSHTYPDDLDILLVGPSGQKVMLMSDCGGGGDIINTTLTFDDNAASSLSDSGQISSGTYKPIDFVTGDTFPSPAPAGPYGTLLSVFNGISPNGTWSLFVQDDASQDVGSMSQGWSISITTSDLKCCVIPLADLALTATVSTNALNLGSNITFTITVTNQGPDTAQDVIVTHALPAGLAFVSAASTHGNCTNNGGVVTCTDSTLPVGTNLIVTINATALTAGNWTNTAGATTSAIDISSANNSASTAVFINTPPSISDIADVETGKSTATPPLPFTIGDMETPAAALTLLAYSSDTNLVSETSIVFGGDATNRTVTITPATNLTGSAVITVVVSDGLAESSDSFTLGVVLLETNSAPELTEIPNYTIVEGETLMFTNNAIDPESPPQTLTFTLGDGAPSGAQVNSTNGVFAWMPTEEQGPGTNVLSVIVTDNGDPSLSATQSFTIIVLETNSAPALDTIPNFTIVEGETLAFTNTATDVDIPTNTLTFSLDSGTPVTAQIVAANGVFSWTPTEDFGSSTNLITVIVTDNGEPSLSTTQSFTVVVMETNSAPVLETIPDFTIVEGGTLSLTNSATDADSPTNLLTFSLDSGAPPEASIDATNGVFSWTTTETDGPTTNLITIIVTDDGVPNLSATQSFTVVILETNSAPELDSITDFIIVEGDTLAFTNTATDVDIPTNTLTFSLDNGAPPEASIDATNGVFSWTTTEADGSTTNLITIMVSDDGHPNLSATQSFTVIILKTNSAPEFDAVPDQFVMEGEPVFVTITATDADIPTNILTFSLDTNAPAGSEINTTNGVFSWTPTEDFGSSTNLVTVIVTDNGEPSLSTTQSFAVIVLETNTTPVLELISDYTIVEGETLVITNTATDADIPTNILTFSLDTNAPTGSEINATNGVFSWTPTEDFGSPTNPITIIVTDAGLPSLSSTQFFTVIVIETNSAPVLEAIPDFTIVEGETLTFTNSTTDADDPTNLLTFSLAGGAPPEAFINATNGVFSWTTTEADGPTTNLITIIASDDGVPSLSATQSFTVIILETNSAPELTAIPDEFIVEGETLVITNTATDTDIPSNVLTFTLVTNAHPEIDFNTETGSFKWTPSEADGPSTNYFTIIVTDNGEPSLSATQTFTVTVLEENTAPTLSAVENQSVYEGQQLTIANSASDTDIPANTLTFSLDTNAPTGVLINENSGLIQWTPDESQGGSTNSLTIIVTDDGVPSLSATQKVTVIVLESNSPPVLTAIPDRTLYAGGTLTFTNTATDPDLPANALAFSLESGSPSAATIDSTNGLFSWTTTLEDTAAVHAITVRVTDDGSPLMFNEQTFHVTVLAGPLIESISVSNDIVTITWSAIDGMAYRLQSITNIFDTNWTDIPPDITAEGATAVHTNTLSTAERYYRVRLVE